MSDKLIHWGLWVNAGAGGWLRDVNGNIFWTTSRAVAAAQIEISDKDDIEIRAFD